MKIQKSQRTFVAVIGASIASAVIISAQQSGGPAAANKQEAATVTYSGCLQPGASAGTFTLINAKEKGIKGAPKVALKVVPSSEKVKLGDRVLQAVEVKGTISDAPAPGGSAETGEVLRTLTAVSVKWQADYCG